MNNYCNILVHYYTFSLIIVFCSFIMVMNLCMLTSFSNDKCFSRQSLKNGIFYISPMKLLLIVLENMTETIVNSICLQVFKKFLYFKLKLTNEFILNEIV